MSFKQKIRNLKDCKDNSSIYDAYYNEELDDRLIYFESRNGLDFAGNIFRIVEELSGGEYGEFTICVYAKKDVVSKIKEYQKNYSLKIDRFITDEKQAAIALERAKYIFTDSGIQAKYIKREGQVFTNTWHGTPLKLMGRDNPGEITSIGHIQHSLLSSDYLIYPNDYMMDKMMNSYMIEKIYPGSVLLEGYPRNSVFFTESKLKGKLGLDGKEIFVYMPTFRGNLEDKKDLGQRDDIEGFLSEIDRSLKDDQLLLVKLHPYNESQIDFSRFNNIKSFPKGYEPYDVINMADCLITDYSSVFFDFANSKRKIIIFNYDEDRYLESRGLYFPLSDLPFPKVSNVDELIREMNRGKEYDDSDFIESFCKYDNPDAVKNICSHIFKGNDACKERNHFNSNDNILVYAGSLRDGDIDRVIDVLGRFDESANNFFITFRQWDDYILENYEHIIEKMPDNVEFLPFRFNLTPTFNEKREYNGYFKSHTKPFPDLLHNLYKRTFDKQFRELNFTKVIDFEPTGYDVAFVFTHSNIPDTVLVCEERLDINNKLKDIFNNFNTVIVPSDDFKVQLIEYNDENKIKLIDEWIGA